MRPMCKLNSVPGTSGGTEMTDFGETKVMSNEPTGSPVLDVEIVRAATEAANTQIANFTRRLALDFRAAAVQAAEADSTYKKASGADK